MRDAIALVLLAGGVGLFFYARMHLQDLAAGHIIRVPGHSALEQSIHYDRLSRIGLWTAAAGLVAAVLSALVRRRRPTSSPGQP